MDDNHIELTIGRLSEAASCRIETIRYYEKIALLPAARRTSGGHRVYGGAELRRLTFIRRCRELGFSVDDIRDLLRLVDGGALTCAEVKSITENHLQDVRQRLADLRNMERALREMVRGCSGDRVPECPIIDSLFPNAMP